MGLILPVARGPVQIDPMLDSPLSPESHFKGLRGGLFRQTNTADPHMRNNS